MSLHVSTNPGDISVHNQYILKGTKASVLLLNVTTPRNKVFKEIKNLFYGRLLKLNSNTKVIFKDKVLDKFTLTSSVKVIIGKHYLTLDATSNTETWRQILLNCKLERNSKETFVANPR